MTAQEQDLVNELFDRLAKLEGNPRDPSADRLIADGLRRAPHAVYALVQTTLVQDEALKRANARIEELQAQTGGESQPRGGFLDSVRDEILGKRDARLRAIGALTNTIFTYNGFALFSGSRYVAGHGPGLWFGWVVSRYGRIDGSGRDRRRTPTQQHPFDVR
jgi:Uncharacterized protein conserved in bacteria (DUF2076)